MDGEQLVARTKSFDDHPTPSGNSMLADVLLRLARIDGDAELERRAAGVLRLLRDTVSHARPRRSATRCARSTCTSRRRGSSRSWATGAEATRELARAALAEWQPNTVVAWSEGAGDAAAQDVALLAGKDLVDGRPAVYVCESFACQAPVTDPRELNGRLTSAG